MSESLRYTVIGNTASPDVIGLILPIQQDEFKVPVSLETQPDLIDIERYYKGSGGGFWGAFDRDQLVGTIGLIAFSKDAGAVSKDAGAIRKMFVRAAYRGKEYRVAVQLLSVLLDHCRHTGIKDLYLGTVDILKAAQRFYEKNGFSRIDKQDLPPSFPLMKVDTLFYHLHIH